MSRKLTTIWQAKPHTLAQIEILRSYLHAWFSILGSRFAGRDLWYIDGFSGPGEYENSPEGSPIAAVKAAHAVFEQSSSWIAGDIRCVFIEEDVARHEHLRSKLQQTVVDPRVRWQTFPGTFVEGLADLKQQSVNPFSRRDPLFTFVDPFGATGFTFAAIADLLSRPHCEVLLNLDSDGISRIYRAGEDANYREILDDVFGDREWSPELAAAKSDPRAVVAMYKRRLKALPRIDYTFAFEMRSGRTSIDYHLVFASQHPLGLEKMKESMGRLDQDGTYSFCSSNVGQQSLFRFDDPSAEAERLHRYFSGRTVSYAEVHDYALNESPFTNPKSMLKPLELDGRIIVNCEDKTRKKGTFPERLHRHLSISFQKRS